MTSPRFALHAATLSFIGTLISLIPTGHSQTIRAPAPPLSSLASSRRVLRAQAMTLPMTVKPGAPRHLSIPSIGVDAAITPVAILPDGKLGVPSDRLQVGWFSGGAKPGEKGSAILDGHLDIGKDPGVFWHLKDVQRGAIVRVTDDAGTMRTFQVFDTELYDVANAPMQHIFAESGDRYLHIITCAGTWLKKYNHYDKRLIVFAREIDAPAVVTTAKS